MRSLFRFVRRIEEVGLATAMLAMAAITIANVLARNLSGESLAAAEELNQFLIVFVCFVGLSYAAGQGRHIRMTALSDAAPHNARRKLMIIICGSTALLLAVLGFYALRYSLSVDRNSPVLGAPLGWIYLLAPLGLWMSSLQYSLAALRNARGTDVYASFDRLDRHLEVESLEPKAGTKREGH